jgi:hypothetical protein
MIPPFDRDRLRDSRARERRGEGRGAGELQKRSTFHRRSSLIVFGSHAGNRLRQRFLLIRIRLRAIVNGAFRAGFELATWNDSLALAAANVSF